VLSRQLGFNLYSLLRQLATSSCRGGQSVWWTIEQSRRAPSASTTNQPRQPTIGAT
jgi:hypothetical protein